jgi:hypothetical protein
MMGLGGWAGAGGLSPNMAHGGAGASMRGMHQGRMHYSMQGALPPPSALPAAPMPFMGVSAGDAFESASSNAQFSAAPSQMQIVDNRPVGRSFHYVSGATTGVAAVQAAKKTSTLKQSIAVDKDEQQGIKSVDDKTFYLRKGVWTDSDFDANKKKPEVIEFGSKKYFDLIASDAELGKYFATGTQIVVVHKGHCYKVVQPEHATG